MEQNIFDALPGFDRMLEQKSFEELSSQEQALVLQFITAEDYTLFRKSVLAAQQRKSAGDLPITPDPAIKNRLMQTFRSVDMAQSASVPRTLSRFFSYRIPLYQAGLAASVLLFLVLYLFLQGYRMTGQMAVADTVYVDRPVRLMDTVWLEKPEVNKPGMVPAENHHPETRSAAAIQPLPENPLYASQMQDAMNRMSVISGLGKDRSVDHDSGLMKLVLTDRATAALP